MRMGMLAATVIFAGVSRLGGETPAIGDLPQVSSLTKDGITWEFGAPVRAGQFVNGDYYLVGPATVTGISPAPADGRNGSVLNVPLDAGISGFDDRVSANRFRESLRAYPPIQLNPGDALVSSISIGSIGEVRCWLRSSDTPVSPVRSVSVLTCLEAPAATDAFRPSYCDRDQRLYHADSLRQDLLPRLAPVAAVPDIDEFAEHFRRPWLDVCFFHFDAAVEYQPAYGREHGRAVGIATLLLSLDIPASRKEPLLLGLVQYAIDIWGMARNGYGGWPAHGGHGSGRKWPLVFAGIVLGDSAMARPNATLPDLRFGEDMQTMYDDCWTGADVVYSGHQGVWRGEAVSTKDGWGPYEHLPPSQWHDDLGENYRRCCTSLAWIGQALAARLLEARDEWAHPAFFDYCDRWMHEDDSGAVAAIEESRGWDYSAGWARQGQCWDDFVEQMWAEYRNRAPVEKSVVRQAVRRVQPSTAKAYAVGGRLLGPVPANAGVYSLRGRPLSRSCRWRTDRLPPGVYVVGAGPVPVAK